MANQAGIDLILRAPNIKPLMADVIDSVVELNAAEKENIRLTKETELAQEALVAKMKQSAETNKNIKKSIQDITAASAEQTGEVVSGGEKQRTGILNTLKVYLQQKSAIKSVLREMVELRQEIFTLDKRQGELIKTARTSDKAYQEFVKNKEKIEDLSTKLKELDGRHKFLNRSVNETEKRYAGLGKVFGVLKAGAVVAVTAIATVIAAGLVGITKLIASNDQVENIFAKSKKQFDKAKFELSAALAPIGFAVGTILLDIAEKLTKFIQDNQETIFNWAINVASTIAGLVDSLPIAFKRMGKHFDLFTNDMKLFYQDIVTIGAAIGSALTFGARTVGLTDKDPLKEEQAKLDRLLAHRKAIQNEIENLDAQEAFSQGFDKMHEKLSALGLAFYKTTNLTGDQKKALAELTKELEALQKQIDELDIKEAGPFAGVLLKAELAAKEIELNGEKILQHARNLGVTSEKIDEIRQKVNRLAQAVRDDAVKFLTDQADAILVSVNKKLDDLRAKQTGTVDQLKFSREIEAQLKEFKIAQGALQAIVDAATKETDEALKDGRAAKEKIIKAGIDALEQLAFTNRKFSELSTALALDFNRDQNIVLFENQKKLLDKQLEDLKKRGEELKNTFKDLIASPVGRDEAKKIEILIKVNEIEAAVAAEQIRQVEESFEIFKKTGVRGVIETEAVIRLRIESSPANANTNPEFQAPLEGRAGKTASEKLVDDLQSAASIYESVFGTINDIVTRSVDIQIDAINRLIDVRQQNVDDLEAKLGFESELKAAGLANDYGNLKKQLDDEIKLRDEASKKAFELSQKRAKLQLQADSLQQVSSIISAVANIFADATKQLGLFGVIAAIAAAGALIASFISFKIQAAKAVRLPSAYKGSRRVGETFGPMAENEGYDDSPGRDRGLSVVDSKGKLRGQLGGDEFLHKQSVSRKHRSALAYLNENEHVFAKTNLLSWLKLAEGSTNTIRLDRTIEKNQLLREKIIIVQSSGITKLEMEAAIKSALKEHSDKLISYYESRPDIVPADWMKDHYKINSKSKKHLKG